MEFTPETMDSEIENLVVFGNGFSPIGMDWEKDADGFEVFHYWIDILLIVCATVGVRILLEKRVKQ